jgi:uncharacterized protein (DUF58 family)
VPVKELNVDLTPSMKNVDVRAKRKVLSNILEGAWTAMLKGRGMEFAGFRQYTYGDDASRIDWNATLRAKDVLVREFEEYRTVNVYFLLDVSDTMLFSSVEKLKAEYAAELMFNLASAIAEAGDSVGYALYSDHIVAKQHPNIGREVVYKLSQELTNGNNYGGKKDFKSVMNLVNSLLQQRSLIVLISDFIDLPEGWERYIQMFATRYDLLGIMVRDPHDFSFPDLGMQVVVEPPSGGQSLLVDVEQYRKAFESEVAEEEGYIKAVFEKAHAGFVKIRTDEDPFDPLIAYFRKRMRMVQ